jgi:23S rRNA pseudouridine1911/1915/1917 synthase
MEEIVFKISEDHHEERLDKFLAVKVPYLSRVRLQDYIKEGFVQVNGKMSKASYRLILHDTVTIEIPDVEPAQIKPQPIPLEILYEDKYLLAINKPAGMVVHPAPGVELGTLVNALIERYPKLKKWGEPHRSGIIHRLDKDTSGVILAALTEETQLQMQAKFQQREIIKTYWALVDGHPKTDTGTIEAEIGRDPKQRKKMAVRRSGKDASTDFRVLQRFEDHTLLELHPETGRTHQIRVHLAFIRCPVAGDRVYGLRESSIGLERFFLHARSITFTHPITGQGMYIEAPLAPELQRVLQKLTQQSADEQAWASREEE